MHIRSCRNIFHIHPFAPCSAVNRLDYVASILWKLLWDCGFRPMMIIWLETSSLASNKLVCYIYDEGSSSRPTRLAAAAAALEATTFFHSHVPEIPSGAKKFGEQSNRRLSNYIPLSRHCLLTVDTLKCVCLCVWFRNIYCCLSKW
jgi:hypothetical protein